VALGALGLASSLVSWKSSEPQAQTEGEAPQCRTPLASLSEGLEKSHWLSLALTGPLLLGVEF
jgi:hypothetical protein